MRVCIPTDSPGGPESPVAKSFHESDFLDFYEQAADGRFALYAQIRNCAGTCKDNVETIVRRGIETVIVNDATANTLHRFTVSGVAVYRALGGPSTNSLEALKTDGLSRLGRIKS